MRRNMTERWGWWREHCRKICVGESKFNVVTPSLELVATGRVKPWVRYDGKEIWVGDWKWDDETKDIILFCLLNIVLLSFVKLIPSLIYLNMNCKSFQVKWNENFCTGRLISVWIISIQLWVLFILVKVI